MATASLADGSLGDRFHDDLRDQHGVEDGLIEELVGAPVACPAVLAPGRVQARFKAKPRVNQIFEVGQIELLQTHQSNYR